VFSETAADYEAFCQMRIKILNLIKMTRQKKNLNTTKKYRFYMDDKKG
jgi:hypothetical protein